MLSGRSHFARLIERGSEITASLRVCALRWALYAVSNCDNHRGPIARSKAGRSGVRPALIYKRFLLFLQIKP
jgi:hypothetical protein